MLWAKKTFGQPLFVNINSPRRSQQVNKSLTRPEFSYRPALGQIARGSTGSRNFLNPIAAMEIADMWAQRSCGCGCVAIFSFAEHILDARALARESAFMGHCDFAIGF